MRRMTGMALSARAYALARWRMRTFTSRAAVERYQARRLAALGQHLREAIPFYRGIDPGAFATWPITDKHILLANFAAMNAAEIPLNRVYDALARGDTMVDSHAIGHSTGTSGNRGYFVVSEAERFVWLGTLLAKALPDALWRRHRVALALPGFSRLYGSAEGGSRVTLGLFDLAEGVDAWADRLTTFAPDTIVAPPKVLRLLAERGALTATTIFSAAEVLDPLDEAAMHAATGVRVRQIYMATEGLFGVSCAHGTLHLAEDVVHFGWERTSPDSDLVQPVVTDFTRRAQAMARYRMNDLLLLSDYRCACGSAFQAVERIEGRRDDLFWLAGTDRALHPVTPDALRNALIDADRAITDFRIVQTSASAMTVRLLAGQGDDAAVQAAFTRLAARMALTPLTVTIARGIDVPFDAKLRRVRREWSPDQSSTLAS
jgi:putative adenylate-forming enzyme